MTRRTCLAITCLQLLLLRHTDHQLTATVQGSGQPHKGELRVNAAVNSKLVLRSAFTGWWRFGHATVPGEEVRVAPTGGRSLMSFLTAPPEINSLFDVHGSGFLSDAGG